MYCRHCYKQIEDDCVICPNCGNPAKKKESAFVYFLKCIPAAFLAWFSVLFMLVSVLNFLKIGDSIFALSVLIVPVLCVVLFFKNRYESKRVYQKFWFWALCSLVSFVLICVTAPESTENNPLETTPLAETEITVNTRPYIEPEATEISETEPVYTVPAETLPATEHVEETAAEPTAQFEDYCKSICTTVDYKDLCRYPDKYSGTYIRVKVKVSQIIDIGFFSDATAWRACTDNSGYGYYFDDEYYLVDKRPEGSVKILEDDIITIYGEFVGLESVTRALTLTTDEIPKIEVLYADFSDYTSEDSSDWDYSTDKPKGYFTTEGEQAALDRARDYMRFSSFSRAGLIEQLKFEGFSDWDAAYGADHVGADWSEQAVKKAESYLNVSSFSYTGMIEQLEFEGFTNQEATHGANNCGADWMEQAVKKAKSYRNIHSYSKDELIDQLMYEGFTYEQAVHGERNSK